VEAEAEPTGTTWVFGYGSLVWRPDFPFLEARTGFIRDRARRFWQASTDHRGVPSRPGRVVTLVDDPGGRCFGTAFRLDEKDRSAILAGLDHRERGGFSRERVPVFFDPAESSSVSALLYVANEANANYLGPAPLEEIARQIRASHGPSGSNVEYLIRLAEALREMGAEDEHVFSLEALLEGRE
jgi:glutathione-specific gamma-glutamylcyclotransferase